LPGTSFASRLVQVIFHHGGHEDHEENKSGTQEPRKGISEMEGKTAKVAAKERGQRLSFKAGTRHLSYDTFAGQFSG